MGLSPKTERALESCYDAIASPGRWHSALDDLAYSIGASACVILPHEVSDRQFGEVCSTEMWKLNERWQRNLDWVKPVYEPRGDPFVRSGYQAVNLCDLFSDDELRHSRFHQEIAKPAGLYYWACGIFSAEGRYWCMPFFRGSEPFAQEELEPIAEIARRTARIVSISEKITRSSAEYEILTLERIGSAALLIDRHGNVSRANRHAEQLFCAEFGVRHGRLWTAASASLARLDRFMAALEYAKTHNSALPAPIVVARGGSPWLMIEAMPVTSASMEVFNGCRALLVLTDLTRPPIADAAVLGLAFGLTRAEARLAAAVCEGRDLETVATAFGVSRLTVRTQLKTVFAKTGTRRQAELVARVSRIRNSAAH